jgi:hypothetical protein
VNVSAVIARIFRASISHALRASRYLFAQAYLLKPPSLAEHPDGDGGVSQVYSAPRTAQGAKVVFDNFSANI